MEEPWIPARAAMIFRGFMMTSDEISIAELVRKRVAEELPISKVAPVGKESNSPNLEREDFYLSLGPETGAGCWFAEKNEDQLVCNINNDNWWAYDKSKHRWVEDLRTVIERSGIHSCTLCRKIRGIVL